MRDEDRVATQSESLERSYGVAAFAGVLVFFVLFAISGKALISLALATGLTVLMAGAYNGYQQTRSPRWDELEADARSWGSTVSKRGIWAGSLLPGFICQVPDDWLLHNRRPLLLGREVLKAVMAAFTPGSQTS